MALLGYRVAHEQHPPSRLLRHARLAEQAGFLAVSSSDHFTPWSSRQGESGLRPVVARGGHADHRPSPSAR